MMRRNKRIILIGYNGVPAPIANQLAYSNIPHCIVFKETEYVNVS
jgi:hypothetical protein